MEKKEVNKKIKNATPVEDGGVKFRSKLEAYTSKKLKEAGLTFRYELDRFELLTKFESDTESYEPIYKKGRKVGFGPVNKNIRAMTYKPDFVNHEDKWIIEVKGFRNDAFPLRWKLFKKLMQGKGYTLFLPGSQGEVIKTIKILENEFKT